MIRIKTTDRAMPNTTQWTERSGLKRDKSRPYAIRNMPAGSSYAGLVAL